MYIYIHICTYIYLRAWPRAGPWALGRCPLVPGPGPARAAAQGPGPGPGPGPEVYVCTYMYVYVHYFHVFLYIIFMYVYVHTYMYMGGEGGGGEAWKVMENLENCRKSMHLNRVWAIVFLSFFFPNGGPELKRFFIVFFSPGFWGQQKW